jgi:hypothetical protein
MNLLGRFEDQRAVTALSSLKLTFTSRHIVAAAFLLSLGLPTLALAHANLVTVSGS